MESTYAINDPKAIYEDDHGGDDHGGGRGKGGCSNSGDGDSL